MYRYIILTLLFAISLSSVYSQVFRPPGFKKTRNIFREVMSGFQFNLESGYGLGMQSQTFAFKEGGKKESMSATSRSIPLAFSVNYKYKQYKLGVYYGFHFITTDSYQLGGVTSSYKSVDVTNSMFAGYFGYEFQFYQYWTHTPELRIGSRSSNATGVETSGITYDLGVNIEHHFSEVVRARIRPSVEFISNTATDLIATINTSQPTYHLTVGISFNVGRLPRCKIKRCAAKIDHLHPMFFTNEFRSNRHNVLIEQNPMHGEHSRKRWDILKIIFRKNKTIKSEQEKEDSNVITHILNLVKKEPEENEEAKDKEESTEENSTEVTTDESSSNGKTSSDSAPEEVTPTEDIPADSKEESTK